MSDDPKKAIEYVAIFLPGFFALGFVVYLTGISLSEFAFAYCAIALSLVIYGPARLVQTRSVFRRRLYKAILVVLTVAVSGLNAGIVSSLVLT